jgi:murein L,D-transpeptidase YafK
MISRQASGFPSIREKQSYRIGSEVYIHGLVNKPELNGLTGEIVKNINEEGRQGVQIGKNVIGLKLKNMKLLYGIINY